jgi:hypothetical protein
MTKASNQRMGRRNGSQSNANSRASASDRKHDDKQVRQNKSIKLGADNTGKLEDWQGGGEASSGSRRGGNSVSSNTQRERGSAARGAASAGDSGTQRRGASTSSGTRSGASDGSTRGNGAGRGKQR